MVTMYEHEPGTLKNILYIFSCFRFQAPSEFSFWKITSASKHDFNVFCTNVTVTSPNYCIPVCNFFLHRFPRRFLRPAKHRPHETNIYIYIYVCVCVLWNEKRGHQLVFYVPTLQLLSWPLFNQFSPNLIST